jgi:hypothetical protein
MMESVEKQKLTWYRMNKDGLSAALEFDRNGAQE